MPNKVTEEVIQQVEHHLSTGGLSAALARMAKVEPLLHQHLLDSLRLLWDEMSSTACSREERKRLEARSLHVVLTGTEIALRAYCPDIRGSARTQYYLARLDELNQRAKLELLGQQQEK